MKKILMIAIAALTLISCTNNNSGQQAAPTNSSSGPSPQDDFVIQFGLKVAFPEGSTFGVLTDAYVKSKVYYISNTGDESSAVGSISIIGADAGSFQLLNSTCPTLEPSGSNYCSVRVRFNPAGKDNRIYAAKLKIDQLELDISADLQVPAVTEIPGGELKIYENASEINTLDFGQTLHSSLAKFISIRHSTRAAVAPVALSASAGWKASKSSCSASEVNNNACHISLIFEGPGKAIAAYTGTLTAGNKTVALNAEVVSLTGKDYGPGAAPNLVFSESSVEITSKDMGTLLVPNRVKAEIRVINKGNAPADGLSLYLEPRNTYYISGSSCQKVLMPNQECSFIINLSSLNKVSGTYVTNVKISGRSESLAITTAVLGISCAADEHVNPETFACDLNSYSVPLLTGHGSKIYTWSAADLVYLESITCDANFLPKPGDLCVFSGQTTATYLSMGGKQSISNGYKVISEIGGSPMLEKSTGTHRIDRGDK